MRAVEVALVGKADQLGRYLAAIPRLWTKVASQEHRVRMGAEV